MAGRVSVTQRDHLVSVFREALLEKLDITPFPHQREWFLASEGTELVKGQQDPNGVSVMLEDGSIQRWATVPRASGRARFIADLGSFKIGKSYGAGLWLASFAVIPEGRVSLVGMEYDICEPEFNYICEFLLSEKGMNLKHVSLANRARDGKMWLDLENGCRFEAKSWERKDTLKGKEIDAYCFCEAYQLPGLECFTTNSQNLRARKGYAIFPTTPDRPWIKELHKLGHPTSLDFDPEWHCTCGVPASVNPITFDPVAKKRDEKLMTKEKFQIHYEGQLGDFVGHVFNYKLGGHQFTPESHPMLFRGTGPTLRDRISIPDGWEVMCAADTGTFYTAVMVALSPEGEAFVIDEFPNYDYKAGSIERDESVTIPQWSRRVTRSTRKSVYWADANSQFKSELRPYGMTLLPNKIPLETRTEITREYFEHNKVWLAPWLRILPFELENAAWPEEATASGKFSRVKDRDHTLDCLEHILSRRPRGKKVAPKVGTGTIMERIIGKPFKQHRGGNRHLGRF